MNIALIAQDNKKDLMVDFCIAYKGILEKHNLFATRTTGSMVIDQTGLKVHRFSPGPLGGEQQIGGMVAYNEIDLVIFLRDPMSAEQYRSDGSTLLGLCDLHNIPFATNIATAEMLVKGVERGDLEWRDLVNPKRDNSI